MTDPGAAVLEVRDLRVVFRTGRELVRAVNGLNLTVSSGETLAVLGESGSGKSVSAAATLRLLPTPPAYITGGTVQLVGEDVLAMDDHEWRSRSGRVAAMVFQDALMALNPVRSVGWQIGEAFLVHGVCGKREARERAISLLSRVGIPDAPARANDYPHQLSGGMRQRAMIAMAVALEPTLLIADEPTTALDVTVQAQIMELLLGLKQESGMSMLLITHDLGVAAETADRIAVMYAGSVAESGPTRELLSTPAHPYTLALLHSAPQGQRKGEPLRAISGSPPDLARLPVGCPFHPRCAHASNVCRTTAPPLHSDGLREVSCHHPLGDRR